MKRSIPFGLIYLMFILLYHGANAYDGSGTLVSQGVERGFVYHAPGTTISAGLPLVIAFHGTGGNGAAFKAASGFDAVADQHQFIVVYPSSYNIGGALQWNVYADGVTGHGGIGDLEAIDDVLFVDSLIGYFCDTYAIDASRIYATGFSNGAFMAYNLAIQRPNVIAAIAPIAGNLWGEAAFLLDHTMQDPPPVAVLHIHGDADAVVAFPEVEQGYVWPLSYFGSMQCGVDTFTVMPISADAERWVFCAGGMDQPRVELVRLFDHGHTWPATSIYDVPQWVWEFFAAHSLDAPAITCEMSGIVEAAQYGRLLVHPNPAQHTLWLDLDPGSVGIARIFDAKGFIVAETTIKDNTLDVRTLAPGLYMLEVVNVQQRWYARFIRD